MSDFWVSKNVCILGGAGFIGSHLADALVGQARSVIVADDLSSGQITNLPKGVEFYQLDLRNYNTCTVVVNGCDVVFHLAANVGGRGYISGDKARFWGNLEIDSTVFRACSNMGVGKVVFFSSACAMHPIDGVYGAGKKIGEMALKDSSLKGISIRPSTVYGPRSKESHAITALIAKTFIHQNPFEVWGDGKQEVDWIYIKDLIDGVLLATENVDEGAVEIGSGQLLTPIDALGVIWSHVGWKPYDIDFRTDMPVGMSKTLYSSKIRSLGWMPKYSIEQGLQETVDWYYANHSVKDVRENLERRLLER